MIYVNVRIGVVAVDFLDPPIPFDYNAKIAIHNGVKEPLTFEPVYNQPQVWTIEIFPMSNYTGRLFLECDDSKKLMLAITEFQKANTKTYTSQHQWWHHLTAALNYDYECYYGSLEWEREMKLLENTYFQKHKPEFQFEVKRFSMYQPYVVKWKNFQVPIELIVYLKCKYAFIEATIDYESNDVEKKTISVDFGGGTPVSKEELTNAINHFFQYGDEQPDERFIVAQRNEKNWFLVSFKKGTKVPEDLPSYLMLGLRLLFPESHVQPQEVKDNCFLIYAEAEPEKFLIELKEAIVNFFSLSAK